jgi:hypothetical protein
MDRNGFTQAFSGEVVLNIAFEREPSSEAKELLSLRLAAFVTAGDLGMLSGRRWAPDQSHVVMISGEVRHNIVSQHLRFENLDMGALRILRNMLRHFSRWSAEIAGAEARPLEAPAENLFARSFALPGAYPTTDFPIVRHTPGRRDKWRLVHITLSQRLDQTAMETMLNDLSCWEELCSGGFVDDEHDPEHSGILPGDLYFLDPFTIEYAIDGFHVAEDAFNALVNFAVAIDRKRCRVSKVEIW